MKIIIANILIIISLLCMVFYSIKKSNNFINIYNIIKDHFKIFSALHHIVVLYILPILTATGISMQYEFSDSMIEAIMVVVSVVISALLAFQGGILNIDKDASTNKKIKILNQTNASINFTVLINIVLVFIMLIYIAIYKTIFRRIFTGIIAYILMITFLTILIIVKRIRILMIRSEE